MNTVVEDWMLLVKRWFKHKISKKKKQYNGRTQFSKQKSVTTCDQFEIDLMIDLVIDLAIDLKLD